MPASKVVLWTILGLTAAFGLALYVDYKRGIYRPNARWSTKYKNQLPDSAFLYVAPSGRKVGGKTVPRTKRKLPYKNLQGKVDLPHLRNALARLSQADIPAREKPRIRARAQAILAQHGGYARERRAAIAKAA